jgi:hypothetical protein
MPEITYPRVFIRAIFEHATICDGLKRCGTGAEYLGLSKSDTIPFR